MYKKLIIVASIVLVVGGVALTWALDQRRVDREEIAGYQAQYAAQTDDFIRQYNEWLQMSPQERTELPLLLDKDGKAKTREQLRQDQQGRFKADVDKMLSGVVTNSSLADILYGDNWQDELTEYRSRRAVNNYVLIGSIVCTSTGGLVYLIWFLFGTIRFIKKVIKGFRELVGNLPDIFRRNKDEESQVNLESVLEELDTTEKKDEEPESQKEPESKKREVVKPVATAKPRNEKRRPMGSLTQKSKEPAEKEKKKAKTNEKVKTSVLLTDGESVAAMAPVKGEPVRLDLSEPEKPIDTLTDLTEQVSAIREYAANQQDRLEKLQDGYDWKIIRTFCLRIIRSIDNIDNRIEQMNKRSGAFTHLEEIRDELVFALESSGIEQFVPDTDTEYRGQEKFAEAVKDKLNCEDPKQTGKIANVIRPGYQYFIDEGNVKIVRPAQVQLYA